ncbi:DUF2624 family protein [Gracilibacillus alcaliphilus]|uniref:DUF2624 family protein n=1 Tax=Gracilibacillus alcaliphilus TaxID=1401441 RepID=UPI00195EA093|nr:DUF2624 family protein [Gracilibacillus alcaliphilus]MBM7675007.1 hypothetical protein [Gracilibacillus alcaliphilus]
MNMFTKKMIAYKLRNLTAKEIKEKANEYKIAISNNQAAAIAKHLKQNNYDPTNAQDRAIMLRKLAEITDVKTAQACQALFKKLIKEYNVEHLFY